MKNLKRYALLAAGGFLCFPGSIVPIAIVGSLDVKEIGFLPWLALLILLGAPMATVPAALGFILIQVANDKYPAAKAVVRWFDDLKFALEKTGHHLAKTLGFLTIVGIAGAVAYATGWYDLFDPEKTTDDWPWYNFLGLIFGGAFSVFLIYQAIKTLGKKD